MQKDLQQLRTEQQRIREILKFYDGLVCGVLFSVFIIGYIILLIPVIQSIQW